MTRDTTSTARAMAAGLHRDFEDGRARVLEISRRAASRFVHRDWAGIQGDAVERLTVYPQTVRSTVERLRREHAVFTRRAAWQEVKAAYLEEIRNTPNDELARTFFNSISRRLFSTKGVDPDLEFVTAQIPPLPGRPGTEVGRVYEARGTTRRLLMEMLQDFRLGEGYSGLERDAGHAADRLDAELHLRFAGAPIEQLEVARPLFFRNKAAYIVGRVRCGGQWVPVAVALRSTPQGIEIEALLTSESDISILFSFTRSTFQVDWDSPRDLIIFLKKKILPMKPIHELYISLGYYKHGKTELYRGLDDHLRQTDDRFEIAPGARGMVMLVFALARRDLVFKIIRDRFDFPKHVTRRQVIERYRLVFERDRVGRLVDAQEFQGLKFQRSRFSPDLLDELRQSATQSVTFEGKDLVFHHLYTERKLAPLNLFLRQADAEAARRAVIDYGVAIKNLAAANIFPGDFLLKNFGVTRHGRVVFYDYDELCLLTDCRFRRIPPARNPEEELSPEPWFAVGENDIFPEEFGRFLGLPDHLREVFQEHHGDLCTAEFWLDLQQRLRKGEIMDFFPYGPEHRLPRG